MRLSSFFEDEIKGSEQYANLVTALSLLHRRVEQGEIPPELPTSMILRYVQNAGTVAFGYEDLIQANEVNPVMKTYIANITPKKVKFNIGIDSSIENPDKVIAAADNPEEKVSQMANRALKRRQK